MKKDGRKSLAKLMVKYLILEYYEAIRDDDQAAEERVYKCLLYWEEYLPMPIYDIDKNIRNSLR